MKGPDFGERASLLLMAAYAKQNLMKPLSNGEAIQNRVQNGNNLGTENNLARKNVFVPFFFFFQTLICYNNSSINIYN